MKLHRKAYVNRARNCPFSNVGEQHFTVRGARFRCVYEARPRDLGMCSMDLDAVWCSRERARSPSQRSRRPPHRSHRVFGLATSARIRRESEERASARVRRPGGCAARGYALAIARSKTGRSGARGWGSWFLWSVWRREAPIDVKYGVGDIFFDFEPHARTYTSTERVSRSTWRCTNLRGRGERTGAHGAERDERRVIAAETHIERGWERSPSPARACDLSHTPHKHDRKPERTTRAGREVARTRDARGRAERAKATDTRASPYQPSSCVKHGDESHRVGGRPSVWYERTVDALVRRGRSAKKWRRGRRRADNRPWRRAPQPRRVSPLPSPGGGEDGRWKRGSGVGSGLPRTPVAPGTAAAMVLWRLKMGHITQNPR